MVLKEIYFNNTKYVKLKINLIALYVLNLSDLFFTKIILKVEPTMFREANIFLAPIIDGIIPYFLKIIVIGAVLYYWYFRNRESNDKELKKSMIASLIMVVLYGMINLLHLFNVALIFYL